MSAWIDWQNDPAAWVGSVFCVLGIAHAMYCYRLDRLDVSHRWTLAMLAFRTCALLLVAIIAWRPTIVSTSTGGPPRPVTVLIDDSASMSTIDNDRSPGEALRIAIALGELPSAVRDRPTGRLLGELNSLDPLLQHLGDAQRHRNTANVNTAEDETTHALSAVVEKLASITHQAATDPTTQFANAALAGISASVNENEPPPMEALHSLINDLMRLENAADDALAHDNPACKAAANSVFARTRFELSRQAAEILSNNLSNFGEARLLTLDGAPLGGANTSANVQSVGSLSLALRRFVAANQQTDSVILLSDGRSTDNWGIASSTLAGSNFTVDTLAVAARGPTSSVSLTRMDVSRRAFVNETLKVHVHLLQRGPGTRQAEVTLTDGQNTQKALVQLMPGENTTVFDWPVKSEVRLHLTCRASMVDTGRAASGVAEAEIQVIDRRVRVLLMAAEDSKIMHGLRQILQSQPWINLTTIAAKGSSGEFNQEQFLSQDIILCGNLSPNAISLLQSVALRTAVEEGGKSLFILPNPTGATEVFSLPESLRPLLPFRRPQAIDRTSMSSFLPTVPPTAKALVIPTPEAQEVRLVDQNAPYDEIVREWLVRPQIARPRDLGPLHSYARALFVDRETRIPILIESAAKAGRVFTLTANDVYDWPDDQTEFWISLIHGLYDPPANVNGIISDADSGPVIVGQKVPIRMRILDEKRATVRVKLVRDGVPDTTLDVHETLDGSNRFIATFIPETVGRVLVECIRGTRADAIEVTVIPADQEVEDTTPDPGLLRRISEMTGGIAYSLDQLNLLPDFVKTRNQARVVTTLNPIWCSGFMFVCIIGCLGCDWAIRKRVGLI